MINADKTMVFCNYLFCDLGRTVRPGTSAAIRSQLLAAGWFIDLRSPYHEILIGQEEKIPAHPFGGGLSPDEIRKLINDPAYDINDDQHYCCLDHAGKDA